MNTVIWTTLFTAAGAVGGALVTAVFADRTQTRQAEEARRKAERASAAAVSDRRRDAYASLLGTARYWLSAALEMGPIHPIAMNFFDPSGVLIDSVRVERQANMARISL
jgi:hypothetical protein